MVEEHKEIPGLAAKNRRLAVILGLVAAAFYLGFILWNLK